MAFLGGIGSLGWDCGGGGLRFSGIVGGDSGLGGLGTGVLFDEALRFF